MLSRTHGAGTGQLHGGGTTCAILFCKTRGSTKQCFFSTLTVQKMYFLVITVPMFMLYFEFF